MQSSLLPLLNSRAVWMLDSRCLRQQRERYATTLVQKVLSRRLRQNPHDTPRFCANAQSPYGSAAVQYSLLSIAFMVAELSRPNDGLST